MAWHLGIQDRVPAGWWWHPRVGAIRSIQPGLRETYKRASTPTGRSRHHQSKGVWWIKSPGMRQTGGLVSLLWSPVVPYTLPAKPSLVS